MKPIDFQEDETGNDPNDVMQAQDRYNVLNGVYGTVTDKHGRSSLMSSFLALAMVDDQFRKILYRMEKPQADKSQRGGLDGILESAGSKILGKLSSRLAGQNTADPNVRQALDDLTMAMAANVADQKAFLATRGLKRSSEMFGNADTALADFLQNTADRAARFGSDKMQEFEGKSTAKYAGAGLVNLVGTMINESRAKEAALGVTQWLNNHDGLHEVRALVNDVVGRTRENAPVFDMISKVREYVQQTRQRFREELPKKLAKEFTRYLEPKEWTALFKALGKTDLASLTKRYGVSEALDLIANPQKLGSEIRKLEMLIGIADPRRSSRLLDKSKQLAHFMMTGEHGVALLRNAHAVAGLGTEKGYSNASPDEKLVEDLDHLISLYALQNLDEQSRKLTTKLIGSQKHGVEFATSYLIGQRVDELDKMKSNPIARVNHYKGHIPSEPKQGGHLRIASEKKHATLVHQGYTKLGDYEGSSADGTKGKRAYYFAPVSGLAPFNQGVMQTVHQTASGVDPQTGYTVGEVMAGRIEDPQMVRSDQRPC